MHRVQIVQGDITRLEVEAVVNAANERMLGGGGVDGALHRAAGPELLRACRAVPQVRPGVRCPVGESRITPAFRLPARYVIHTVGPVWRGGSAGEAEKLASCYQTALKLAHRHHLGSVAFPAISCGVYGYPVEKAAGVAVGELSRFLATDRTFRSILLVAFGRVVKEALEAALETDSSARKAHPRTSN